MSTIKSNKELLNDYNGISILCHTETDKGNHIVMSAETYEHFIAHFDLYSSIEKGIQDICEGNTRPFFESITDLKKKREYIRHSYHKK